MNRSIHDDIFAAPVPALPRIPADPVKRSRYRGCLVGGACGDALGAPVEFLSLSEIHRQFGVTGIGDYAPAYGRLGAITDDTQMTLFTAEGMLRGQVRAALRGIGPVYASVTSYAYLRWLLTQGYRSGALPLNEPEGWLLGQRELFSRRAPGNTCISALRAMKSFGEKANNESKGCGGVMRVAPVGMFTANWLMPGNSDDPRIGETFAIGSDIASITHGHPTGQLTAGVLATVIALLLTGMPLLEAIERAKQELRRHQHHAETLSAIEQAQRLARSHPPKEDVIADMGQGWIAEEALAISLYCALTANDFESGVKLAVNHSGDSDSTGAITGNLLGAMLGIEAIPSRWRKDLELSDVIEETADDLATVRDWDLDEFTDSAECAFYWSRYPGV